MNISEEAPFDNTSPVERLPWLKRVYLSLIIGLVALLSFGIGRLTSTAEKAPIQIQGDVSAMSVEAPITTQIESGIIGSKNGTKFHYSHCPGAKQIAEKNRVIFASAAAAEASGYTLAANCSAR